jgi:hypothetical protein
MSMRVDAAITIARDAARRSTARGEQQERERRERTLQRDRGVKGRQAAEASRRWDRLDDKDSDPIVEHVGAGEAE